jgi:hypothetical protein
MLAARVKECHAAGRRRVQLGQYDVEVLADPRVSWAEPDGFPGGRLGLRVPPHVGQDYAKGVVKVGITRLKPDGLAALGFGLLGSLQAIQANTEPTMRCIQSRIDPRAAWAGAC